jgi:hypothetical protein
LRQGWYNLAYRTTDCMKAYWTLGSTRQ